MYDLSWDLGHKTGIWAPRLVFWPQGWYLGIGAGIWALGHWGRHPKASLCQVNDTDTEINGLWPNDDILY